MAVDQSTDLLASMSLTENGSFTFGTTESACLNFYFDVLQNTPSPVIESHLNKAWAEDALLTLKLIFQLRDIRKGKGAKIEFHHCLLWLYEHHPLTLIENAQYVAQHGYWKDLGWLIKFIMTGNVSMTTERAERVGHRSRNRFASLYLPAVTPSGNLEDVINQRLKGEITKKSWNSYLSGLNSEDAKLEARKRFLILSKEFALDNSRRAKEAKKAARVEVTEQLQELRTQKPKFAALYDKIVQIFANTLMEDKETLVSTNCLPTTALCGKWAPTLNCSIDSHTLLGRNIVRALFPAEGNRRVNETDEAFFDRIKIAYRKVYLNPLREAIKVVEAQMSRKQWNKIEYNRVPSVSMKRNTKSFQEHDQQRFTEYLGQVKAGEKKIASGALLPHEIVSQLMESPYSFLFRPKRCGELSEQVAELQWKSYVDNLRKSGILDSAMAVADVSGSMNGTPMEVAIGKLIIVFIYFIFTN
jgi:Domain of unknown function (DUF2828)